MTFIWSRKIKHISTDQIKILLRFWYRANDVNESNVLWRQFVMERYVKKQKDRKVEFYKRMRCHSGYFVRFCIQSDCCSCCQNKQDGGRLISSLRRKSGCLFDNFFLSTLENVRFQRFKLFLRIVFFISLSDKIHKNTLNLSWTLDKTVCRKSVSFSVSMCFTAPFYIKAP